MGDGVPEEDDEANNSKIEDPSKMTADEKIEVEEKVGEALEENFVSLEKKGEKATEEKKEEPKEGEASGSKEEETEGTEDEDMEEGDDSQEEEGEDEKDADKSASETTTDCEKAGDAVEKKEAEEEEPSNLQIAWEM